MSAHAHNDYEHAHPLHDALNQGFCSVEADIHLVDGKLLVAHDRRSLLPERTLQRLYLDPLRAEVRKNSGRVYRDGPEFTLLVDIKTEAKPTYAQLRRVLEQYADLITTFSNGVVQTNAILVVLSGNRSRDLFAGESTRLATLDGTPADLASNDPPALVPWISANWAGTFTWRGTGEFPASEKAKLAEMVAQTHGQGRRLRFWGAPDNAAFWSVLRETGVDLINTDHLVELREFLTRTNGVANPPESR